MGFFPFSGLYHFSFSARGGSTGPYRWKRSGPRPCFTPSPPLDGVRVVEVDGFRFPWDPNTVRRQDTRKPTEIPENGDTEPIVVDNLRKRYYYNNRLPPGETGDCEDQRGGRVPTQYHGGEWRYDEPAVWNGYYRTLRSTRIFFLVTKKFFKSCFSV